MFVLVIKAEIATPDIIEKLEGKPLKFPDEDDQIDNFKGLQAQIAIPTELLKEALDATGLSKIQLLLCISLLSPFRWNQIASCKYSI